MGSQGVRHELATEQQHAPPERVLELVGHRIPDTGQMKLTAVFLSHIHKGSGIRTRYTIQGHMEVALRNRVDWQRL